MRFRVLILFLGAIFAASPSFASMANRYAGTDRMDATRIDETDNVFWMESIEFGDPDKTINRVCISGYEFILICRDGRGFSNCGDVFQLNQIITSNGGGRTCVK